MFYDSRSSLVGSLNMVSMIKLVVAVSLLGGVSASQVATLPKGGLVQLDEDRTFHEYMAKHRREYKHGSEEYELRKELFNQRLAAVSAHNSNPDRLWEAAPTPFTDRTEEERKRVRGYRKFARANAKGFSLLELEDVINVSALPEKKDWMHLKAAHQIKDQGSCGSCWAVTTASTLEAHSEIYNKKARSFSAQQIVECTPNPRACGGTGGCEGATVELGMDYILKNGLATDEEAPYHGSDHACTAVPQKKMLTTASGGGGAAFGLLSYKTLPSNQDAPLAEAVAKYGPVAISAAAGPWFEYSSGIFNGCSKDSVIDHAITLFGYGKEEAKKYWLIKNSWGRDWGEKGYIRVLRHDSNEKYCGTDNNNQEGVGCKGDPKEVTVCGMCGMLYDSVVPYFKGSPGHKAATSSLAGIKSSGEVSNFGNQAPKKPFLK